MNAIEKIRNSLGIKRDDHELVTVVSVGNGVVEVVNNSGKKFSIDGNFAVGTRLIINNSRVESVVVQSGVVVYD